jgi:hypothetical protein
MHFISNYKGVFEIESDGFLSTWHIQEQKQGQFW